MRKTLIALAAVGLVLAGCGTSTPGPAPAPAAPQLHAAAPTSTTKPYTPGETPAAVSVPSIGAQSSLVPLGLNADGTMQVPDVHHPKQAGWFEPGPEPGQDGPAVIVGHIDGDHIPGVFAKLADVKVGDRIQVAMSGGGTEYFVVYATERAPKDGFPAQKVFGYTPDPELRLITCGGSFDRAAHSYRDNQIVYAHLV